MNQPPNSMRAFKKRFDNTVEDLMAGRCQVQPHEVSLSLGETALVAITLEHEPVAPEGYRVQGMSRYSRGDWVCESHFTPDDIPYSGRMHHHAADKCSELHTKQRDGLLLPGSWTRDILTDELSETMLSMLYGIGFAVVSNMHDAPRQADLLRADTYDALLSRARMLRGLADEGQLFNDPMLQLALDIRLGLASSQ